MTTFDAVHPRNGSDGRFTEKRRTDSGVTLAPMTSPLETGDHLRRLAARLESISEEIGQYARLGRDAGDLLNERGETGSELDDAITAVGFTTDYPTLAFTPGQSAVVNKYGDGEYTCDCGNDHMANGWTPINPTGKAALLPGELPGVVVPETLDTLDQECGRTVCNLCGLVYDDAQVAAGESTKLVAIGRINVDSDKWQAAVADYDSVMYG